MIAQHFYDVSVTFLKLNASNSKQQTPKKDSQCEKLVNRIATTKEQ